MITSALTLLVMLFLLEILFTAGCGAVLLLRRSDAPPGGKAMRRLWTVVLLLSLVPLRLFTPAASVTVYENAPDDIVRIHITDYEPEASGEEAVPVHAGALQNPLSSPKAEPLTIRLPSASADAVRLVLTLLVSVWLIGAAISGIGSLSEKVRASSLLRRHSFPCSDARILSLYQRCAQQMGMKSPPPLRMFRDGMILSPCCSGILRPAVYISDAQRTMSDEALSLILIHELSHIRSRDTLLSLLVSAACAVHWGNPLCEPVSRAITEDCELGCDETVLRVCGDGCRVPYIHAILDIASGITAYAAETGSFSAVRDRGAEFIKRRYDSMRNRKSRRLTTVLAAVMCGVLLAGNIFAMSSCAFPTAASDSPAVALKNPVLAEALAEYFGLTSAEELTEYHMSQITSLEISRSGLCTDALPTDEEGNELIPVRIRINEGVLPTSAGTMDVSGGGAKEMFAEGYVFETLPILADRSILDGMTDAIKASENGEWNCMKFQAFYCLKDASAEPLYAAAYDMLVQQFCDGSAESYVDESGSLLDINGDGKIDTVDINAVGSARSYAEAEAIVAALPADVRDSCIAAYTEQLRNEMLTLFPYAEVRPMYVLDPYSKPREVSALLVIMQSAGLLENRTLRTAEFDLADTAMMGSLRSLTVSEDLTPLNLPE